MILPPTVSSPDLLVQTTLLLWVTYYVIIQILLIHSPQPQPIIYLCISGQRTQSYFLPVTFIPFTPRVVFFHHCSIQIHITGFRCVISPQWPPQAHVFIYIHSCWNISFYLSCVFLWYLLNIISRSFTIFLFLCVSWKTRPSSLSSYSTNKLNHLTTHFLSSMPGIFLSNSINMCHLHPVYPLNSPCRFTITYPILGCILYYYQNWSKPDI